jgi:oligo-1,6-glucosidase/alpha-glucosidase
MYYLLLRIKKISTITLLLLLHLNLFAQNNTDTLPWYHSTSIYQIYPRSYQDSNGDGIGDIQGIISRLDYIQQLGFKTIWCSPFYASPQKDFGYDISDYMAISPEYGTLQDAEQLITETHKRGMKIVFDMVMNHTSDQHHWFKESASSKTNPKAEWYLWTDKPNNWKSVTGGKAWHYVASRNQYYYAAFLPFQPDLNYRNPEVKKAMFDIVRFWLKQGVDGFRLDMFDALYEDAQLRNNTPSHKRTICDEDNARFAKELRAVCEEFGGRMLLGEIFGSHQHQHEFLGKEKNDGITLSFNFEMLRMHFSPRYFSKLITKLNTDFPKPFSPVFTFSNHDRRRNLRRLKGDKEKYKLVQFIQFTTRSVPCFYYGEEIGMQGVKRSYKYALDPLGQKYKHVPRFLFDMINESINRDEMRTPMQWDTTTNAGFSSGSSTWLPIEKAFKNINAQSAQHDSSSIYYSTKQLLSLRNSILPLKEGELIMLRKNNLPHGVIGYKRSIGGESVTAYINFSKQKKVIQHAKGSFLLHTVKPSDTMYNGQITLSRRSAVIVK